MLKPQGYAIATGPDGVREWDTTTCAHCNAVTHIQSGCRPEDIGGLCKVCMGLICPKCVGKTCVPFLKKLERLEARYNARRWMGI